MKKILLSLVILLIVTSLQAQRNSNSKKTNNSASTKKSSNTNDDDEAKLLIGTHGGFKGQYGLFGPQASYLIAPKTYANAGIGLSLWSIKLGADVMRHSKVNRTGFGYGAGLAYAKGNSIPASFNANENGTIVTGQIRNKGVAVINFILGYGIKLGRRSSMQINTGYGQRLGQSSIITFDNPTLDINDAPALKLTQSLIAPHGLITNIGFLFPIL
jgi:hypothetical protein